MLSFYKKILILTNEFWGKLTKNYFSTKNDVAMNNKYAILPYNNDIMSRNWRNNNVITLRNMEGSMMVLQPDHNNDLKINWEALNSGKLYLNIDDMNGEVEIRSNDGGSAKLKPDNQGRIRIIGENGGIIVPIDQSDDMSEIMDYMPVCGYGVGKYNADTGRWSW
ncbi:hypothetical protein BH23THE1_BH23THE1_34400 [soil metagenome]